MFKWPGVPSTRAPEHELADFAELLCWKQGTVSVTDLYRDLGRLAENDYSRGVPEEEDIPSYIEDAFQEMERRKLACGGGYPFQFGNNGNVLYMIHSVNNYKCLVYKYLLLATRLNMSNNRQHGGIDGTELLEYLSAEVAREYLGGRAVSIVFGTAEDSPDFPNKIDNLCLSLGEGEGFFSRGGGSKRRRDGKLDVVAWKPFSDQREGKLIAFGQCKTGTNWKADLTQLQPEAFCSKWFKSQPVHIPVRMFFVAEALPSIDWRNESVDAGLLFDRCRIVDFCDHIEKDLSANLRTWTAAASNATGLPFS